MTSRLLWLILIAARTGLADHPGEGPDKLSDLINEAFANSPAIQARSEFLQAAKSHAEGTKASLVPTFSAAGGRKLEDSGESQGSLAVNFAQLDATWNLYRGGSDKAKQNIADTQTEISARELEAKKLEIAASIAESYYELQYVSESLALIEKMIGLTRSGKDAAKRRSETGQTTDIDALEFDILDSKLRSQRAAYQADEAALVQRMRSYLGRSDSQSVRVHGHLTRSSWSMNPSEANALKANPTVAVAQLNAERAKFSLDETNAGFLPSVDAKGSWGKLASGNPSSTKPSWSTEIRVTVPIFSGLSTVKDRSSKAHERAAYELEATHIKRDIQTDLNEQLSRLKSLETRLTIEENSASQAEKFLKMTQSEYRRGIRNSPDLAAAMDLVLTANLRNLELRREWYLSRARALTLAGKIPSA